MKKIVVILLVCFMFLFLGFCNGEKDNEGEITAEITTTESITKARTTKETTTKETTTKETTTKETTTEETTTEEEYTEEEYTEEEYTEEEYTEEEYTEEEFSEQAYYAEDITYYEEETSYYVQEEETNSSMVWIPKSGKKYHSSEYCSNMKGPSCVTLDEAISYGYTACSKCW